MPFVSAPRPAASSSNAPAPIFSRRCEARKDGHPCEIFGVACPGCSAALRNEVWRCTVDPGPSRTATIPGLQRTTRLRLALRCARDTLAQQSCDGMRLLVTRPQHDGERTAARLRARGHEVTLAPLLSIDAVDAALPREPLSAVVMTSANAARIIARHPRRDALTSLPAFTVGRHTAEAARAAGFRAVECADGDKDDLAALLRARFNERSAPLLYLAGEDRDRKSTRLN